jgi:hypothetical protein
LDLSRERHQEGGDRVACPDWKLARHERALEDVPNRRSVTVASSYGPS